MSLKKNASLGLVALFLICSSFPTMAQSGEKFGHINSLELLSYMPEIKKADQELKQYQKKLQQQSKSMMQEYQKKMKEYQKKQDMMMDAVKKDKKNEIRNLEQRIRKFRQNAQQKLASKKQELYKPILEDADNAIQKVAKENGYTYIFDSSAGALLYAQDSDNILELVKNEMGLDEKVIKDKEKIGTQPSQMGGAPGGGGAAPGGGGGGVPSMGGSGGGN
ncbi:MAG: outer membrane chaperone Skp [Bacteroidetes bacterium SW_11_45_7]|nr:MAG: outer membrane chaperone Skp [Bacteroidetes bacterium SW_11_45_7]